MITQGIVAKIKAYTSEQIVDILWLTTEYSHWSLDRLSNKELHKLLGGLPKPKLEEILFQLKNLTEKKARKIK